MAGKPKQMSQIKQLIRLYQDGNGIKTIARILGMSKNTVRSYLKKMADGGFNTEELLKQEDPLLEKSFHSGNPAYKADKFEYLKSRLDYYQKELKRTGVTKQLLWQEYMESDPTGYSYPQFTYHLRQQLISRKGSMVMEHIAGDKLYIDFSGKKLHYIDRSTGELIACEIFVACLPFSDYAFAIAVRSQQTPDFLYALSCCLEAMGGVPKAIVPDNLKAAVIKANKYEPVLNQSMEDFANHYGTVVVPARSGKPKDKSLVENQVKMIYSRVFAPLRNQQFFDIHALNQAINTCMIKHNQTRMQQKPYCREERFLSTEKATLGALPSERFALKYYAELKVGNNGHIYLQRNKHYYSVPFTYIGMKVKLIYTRTMVSIYCQGKQIAVHIRSYQENKYTTLAEHLKSEHQAYKKRSHEIYLARAKEHSPEFHELMQVLFKRARYPEQLYRTCDGLFRLKRDFPIEEFDKACKYVLKNKLYTYYFFKNVLEKGIANIEEEPLVKDALPEHPNIRGRAYYASSQPTLFDQQKDGLGAQ